MPYLIDGHNLIPKIPGLDLGAIDDESQLIELLQVFCRHKRKQVEVVFDNAPAGQPRARNFGLLVARFARSGQTADDLIQARLQRLGGASRNWTVVSSDRQVQAAARGVRAHYVSSEAFAQLLLETLDESSASPAGEEEASISEDEIDGWLALFGAEDEAGE